MLGGNECNKQWDGEKIGLTAKVAFTEMEMSHPTEKEWKGIQPSGGQVTGARKKRSSVMESNLGRTGGG